MPLPTSVASHGSPRYPTHGQDKSIPTPKSALCPYIARARTQSSFFSELLPIFMSNAAFAEILTLVNDLSLLLPVPLFPLCHSTCGSGSYHQLSLLPHGDPEFSGWKKLLLRDEEELGSSEPLANESWRGLFSALCLLSDALLDSLAALGRKWQKGFFYLNLAGKQSGR